MNFPDAEIQPSCFVLYHIITLQIPLFSQFIPLGEVEGRFFKAEKLSWNQSHKHQPSSICLSAQERSSLCEAAGEKAGCAIAAEAFEEKE